MSSRSTPFLARAVPAAQTALRRMLRPDIGAAILVAFLLGLPILSVLAQGLLPAGRGASWQTAEIGRATVNSLTLGALVTLMSTTLAVPLAVIAERTPLGRIPGWDILWVIPFTAPPYLTSMGWILATEPAGGYLSPWLATVPFLSRALFSSVGLAWIIALHLFPVMYLGLRQRIRMVGKETTEAARVHGLSVWKRLIRIDAPLWLPAAAVTGTIVFVKTLGEFGAPLIFGSLIHFPVLTTQIYEDVTSWPVNFPLAARLASILFAAGLAVWWLRERYALRHQYALVSGRSGCGRPRRSPWGLATAIVAGLFVLFVLTNALVLPLGSILWTSLLRVPGRGWGWANLTLRHYGELLAGGRAMHALVTTFELALASAGIATGLAWVLACIARFYPTPWSRWTDYLALVPNTVPDILPVIGLILLWNAPWMPFPLYDTKGMLVLSFVVLFLPFALSYLSQGFRSLSPTLWEAARVHGLGRRWLLGRLFLPLLAPAALAGAVTVFAVSFRDLVVPMLISPPNVQLVSTYIYGQFNQGSLPRGMAMAYADILVVTASYAAAQRAPWHRRETARPSGDVVPPVARR